MFFSDNDCISFSDLNADLRGHPKLMLAWLSCSKIAEHLPFRALPELSPPSPCRLVIPLVSDVKAPSSR